MSETLAAGTGPLIEATALRSLRYDGKETREVREMFVKLYKSIRTTGLLSAVSGNALKVLVDIATYIDDEGEGWPSQDRIASDVGLTIKTVQRCIKELEGLGAIAVEQRRHNGSGKWAHNTYTLTPENAHFRFGREPGADEPEPDGKKGSTVEPPDGKVYPTVEPPDGNLRGTVNHPIKKNQSFKEEPVREEEGEKSLPQKQKPGSLSSIWETCLDINLKPSLGHGFMWVKDAELLDLNEEEAVLRAPNENIAEMIQRRLSRSVLEALETFSDHAPENLRVVVGEAGKRDKSPPPEDHVAKRCAELWQEVMVGFDEGMQKELAGSALVGVVRRNDCLHATIRTPKPVHRSLSLRTSQALQAASESDSPWTVGFSPPAVR